MSRGDRARLWLWFQCRAWMAPTIAAVNATLAIVAPPQVAWVNMCAAAAMGVLHYRGWIRMVKSAEPYYTTPGMGRAYVRSRADILWYDTPPPPRWHVCTPWTVGKHPVTSAGFYDVVIQRCRCGATRTGISYPHANQWTGKNKRRDSATDTKENTHG